MSRTRSSNGSTQRKDDLLDLSDSYHDLEHFYEHQKPTWDRLRKAYTTYTLNRSQLEQDAKAAPALRRMQEILVSHRVRTASSRRPRV